MKNKTLLIVVGVLALLFTGSAAILTQLVAVSIFLLCFGRVFYLDTKREHVETRNELGFYEEDHYN